MRAILKYLGIVLVHMDEDKILLHPETRKWVEERICDYAG